MKNPQSAPNLKSSDNKKVIANFFIRIIALFTFWFFFNAVLLKPSRIIDQPLSTFIANATVKSINLFSKEDLQVKWQNDSLFKHDTFILKNNRKVLRVSDGCNGLDLIFIYVGVICLLPFSLKRKLIFTIAGSCCLVFANIIRIASLYFIYVYQRNTFDVSHHYLFTALMYALIFGGWLLFIKKDKINEKK